MTKMQHEIGKKNVGTATNKAGRRFETIIAK